MNSKKSDKRGFTLAELLIVVAILAVLAAVAIPVFGAQLKKARLAADHAAIRDAYAIVQIANNLQEVEIDGVIYTFEELDADIGEVGHIFYLSKDCSSLVSYLHFSNAYTLQEDGSNGTLGNPSTESCPDCTIWDNSNTYVDIPTSKLHLKDSYIFVIYDKLNTHQLYLGFHY